MTCPHPCRDYRDPRYCGRCGTDLIAERAPFQRGGRRMSLSNLDVPSLDGLHASNCGGQEFSKCAAIGRPTDFEVVLMMWCGDCGAADYEVV